MRISFHGAAREVTGSCHLVEARGKRVLLDCGMIQGGAERHERNREPFPFDPRTLDCVVLSHAHIDHSGRLPLLRRAGYAGPIVATPPTCKLTGILLADSGRIQEEDARWKAKRLRKAGADASWVTPLYTRDDAVAVLDQLAPLDFGATREIDGFGTVSLLRAGHILGAAIVQLDVAGNGERRRLVFSGDLGTDHARLVGGPASAPRPDTLLLESTYGDTRRPHDVDTTEALRQVIERTIGRGGNVVIPSFAVGRTQALLARINDLVEQGRIGKMPVYVDSPMAISATAVFSMFPDAYSDEARKKMRAGDLPLEFPGLRMTPSVEESKAIQQSRTPSVILSASGMATAGRIKHHLKNNISDPRSTILFVGYQAQGTLGRLIKDGTDPVRIFGEWYPVRAAVESIDGFSAHADLDGLLGWFGALDGRPGRTYLVHGEERAALHLAESLRATFGAAVEVPTRGQTFELDGP